ncbi:MAG: radical SAM protein [Lachnospiraceae bacterium]|nr:radical SAM protein [Lachnospiraceae bacterium]
MGIYIPTIFSKKMSLIVKSIVFDITDSCNMRCKHCYKKDTGEVLSSKDIEKFLSYIDNSNTIKNIVISGGEPLLHEDIRGILLMLNGKYNIRLNTNGILLDKYIDVLSHMTMLKIQISLDGYDDNTYYAVRNCNGFEKAIYNAILCRENGLNVCFRTTLTQTTIDNYIKFIEISKKTKIPLKIKPMVNIESIKAEELHIKKENLLSWYDEIEEQKYYEFVEGNLFNDNYECSLIHDKPIISTMYVTNNGNMFPCIALQNEFFKLGNIKNVDLEKMYKRMIELRNIIKRILNSSECEKCGYRKNIGNGKCIASCLYGSENCFNNMIKMEYYK